MPALVAQHRRVGWAARKSRWHVNTIDNRGGYMLIAPIMAQRDTVAA